MPTSEQREHLIDLQDRLIDFLVQQDEASQAGNWDRARELTTEIGDARSRRDKISRSIAQDSN